MENLSNLGSERPPAQPESQWLQRILDRVSGNLQRDAVVREMTLGLQQQLKADRVALYYFFRKWKGQVVSEALSNPSLAILGATGADDCFNGEYAALYEAGRYRAIADTSTEPIHECHRDFLKSIQVQANLVVPILTAKGLWGLLVAHHCQTPHIWLPSEIEQMKNSAQILATTPSVQDA